MPGVLPSGGTAVQTGFVLAVSLWVTVLVKKSLDKDVLMCEVVCAAAIQPMPLWACCIQRSAMIRLNSANKTTNMTIGNYS